MSDYTKLEREIARNIVYAQIASDGGKQGTTLRTADTNMVKHIESLGYAAKDGFIIQAMNLCQKQGHLRQFNYWAERKPDQNGRMSNVIYFDFKIDNKRYQVSFHCFNRIVRFHYVNSGRKTRWDHNKGGSIESCKKLIARYGI